jgi:hypothetical protein
LHPVLDVGAEHDREIGVRPGGKRGRGTHTERSTIPLPSLSR